MESKNNKNISQEGNGNTSGNAYSFNDTYNIYDEIPDTNLSNSLIRLMNQENPIFDKDNKEISKIQNGANKSNILDSSKNNNGNTVGKIIDNIKIEGKNLY